jgi:hypothetical protein
MRHTDVLIGVHGSGLNNAQFMEPGGVVINMLPQNYVEYDWSNQAASGGQHFFFLFNTNYNDTTRGCRPAPAHCYKNMAKSAHLPHCKGAWRPCNTFIK